MGQIVFILNKMLIYEDYPWMKIKYEFLISEAIESMLKESISTENIEESDKKHYNNIKHD